MDFFQAEARAKQRTSRLLTLFALAVVGTIIGGYFGAIGIKWVLGNSHRSSRHYGYVAQSDGVINPPDLWQPAVLGGVAVATLAVIGLASLYKWSEFSRGGSAVAESVGARRVDPNSTDLLEHRLLNVVEEMAIASGVHMPAVYIIDDEPGINAFAAGLTSNDAVVTVTRGTMEKLSRDELQGVIGHEFSHILNGDMTLNVRLSTIIFGILVIGLAGRAVLWSLRGMRVSSGRDKNGGGAVVAVALIGVALLIVGYIGYFFGRLIQAAVSRQREFLADASSVQFTRNPQGVTGALKKIGGYALGSSMQTHKAADIGHFFFAQAFESNFGGLWATHPPLSARIVAIEPQFDGKFFEPPQVVDVAKETWSQVEKLTPPPIPVPVAPLATLQNAIGSIGLVTADAVQGAQDLLAQVPAPIRIAARSPDSAKALIYGLLLDAEPEARKKQQASIAGHAGSDALLAVADLEPSLAQLKPEHRLPLVQLAMPALKTIPASALQPFADTLDELIHADGRVTSFEFALQKIVLRGLAVSRAPSAAVTQLYSFQAVAGEISVVLSALAHASSASDAAALGAFTAGAAQLKLLEGKLAFISAEDSNIAHLDQALDKLATASGPIKQRLLTAGAYVISADGVLLIEETELLRAVAAALDVPMPPLATG